MVGPSLSDDEMRLASSRLRIGFVLLVGVSAGLIAVTADATLPQVGLAFAGGTVLGIALMVFLSYWGREFTNVNRRR
ncbi:MULTISPECIES: hypothetical protein [Haloferax]|uniref:Uncharacterized protein n=2 Tax=Haloferax TaxID=2251 RepID=A0A6G1Z2Q0_9EURY|nr:MULTISPECIES: hypothetical protein [Haloferax]KAB1188110.1 hypothetical protein Hfx1149_08695 [Haloferax sp. CBA1149]MRW80783.1 hypothetical protein [Haloferax marinisediminis]